MIDALTLFYVQPDSRPYRFFSFIQHHLFLLMVLLTLLLLGYPTARYSYASYQQSLEQPKIEQLRDQLRTQQRLLAELKQQQNTALQAPQLASLNSQIRDVLEAHHISLDSLQWQFDGGHSLSLSANQTTVYVLNTLAALNELESFQFSEISLNKLHRQQRIQLNATLRLNP